MGTKIKAILWTLIAMASAFIGSVVACVITNKPVSFEPVIATFVIIVAIDYFEFKFKQENKK